MATRTFLRSKIHRATITEANPDYVGSVSIDEDLMDAVGIKEYEQVHVAGLTGGGRVISYAMKAPRCSGTVGMNGGAALLIEKGELVIIFAYADLSEDEVKTFEPRIAIVDAENKIVKLIEQEIHGNK